TRFAAELRHDFVAVKNRSLDRRHFRTPGGDDETHDARVDVGGDLQAFDAAGGDGLQPDRLPDAGAGGVHDAAGALHGVPILLPLRLEASCGVGDGNDELIFAWLERVGNVERERVEAPLVRTLRPAVDEDFRFPVHGTEV